LKKNLNQDEYIIRSNDDLKIFNLIKFLNKNLKNKLKVNWIKNTKNFRTIKLNNLPIKKYDIKKKILKLFNENN
jgi:hypothetical protein